MPHACRTYNNKFILTFYSGSLKALFTQGPFIAGEGLDMERKGRDILAGSWRGEHQLLQIDYSSGAIIADIEPERQNSYASCVQVIYPDICVLCSGNSYILIYASCVQVIHIS